MHETIAKTRGGKKRLTDADHRLVEAGRRLAEKVLNAGLDASFTSLEIVASEAIAIADGTRPALLVKGDAVDPKDEKAGQWADELTDFADAIKAISPSVGRIDVDDRHVGTGWMIRPGYIVTNRHVAQELSKAPTKAELALNPLRKATVCFGYEAREKKGRPKFAITKILYCGDTYIDPKAASFAALDLAVLQVDPRVERSLPSALPPTVLPRTEIVVGTDIYVFGYPGPTWGSRLPERTLLSLFGDTFSVKRLSPGEVIIGLGSVKGDTSMRTIAHDATTLGGSSGSAILGFDELSAPQLVGLHFSGSEVVYGPSGVVEYKGRNYSHCFAAMSDVIKLVDAAIAADRRPAK